MLMLETTYQLNNMKIADINSKYIDYIRSHKLVEKYGLYDFVNGLEFDDNFIRNLRDLFYCNKEFQIEHPNEFDLEIAIDDLIVDFRVAYENQLKYEKDPEYDIDPWKDENTEYQMEILATNVIPVWVEGENGTLEKKFMDKRMLDGTLWKPKD